MKILLLANELNTVDGVTTHLYSLVKGLSAYKDINITLITGRKNTNKLDSLNVNIISNELFLHEKRGYFSYFWAGRFLKKFIKINNIDIVHSHTHYAANIAKSAAKNGMITIQTNHGLLNEKGRLKHFCADKYVIINEHIYEYLLNNKIADKKDIYFIRCGIEIPDSLIKKQNGKLKIIAASRLTHGKGLDVFIKAVSKLTQDEKAKAEFIIAGKGEEESNLIKLNDGLQAGVIFAGKIENMNELLTQTHVFVFPGRSTTEGFPAAITEAAAHNNLIVTSNFLGVDSIIKNNKDGLVFEKENDNELAQLLSCVIKNYNSYIPLAEGFYNKVKLMYDLKTMAEKHYNMYQSCREK